MKDYTLMQASRELRISDRYLRMLVHQGSVPYVQLPSAGKRRGHIRFTPEQIAEIRASWLREPVQSANGVPDPQTRASHHVPHAPQ